MQPSPVISSSSALFISLSFAVIYVGSLYLSKNARLSFVSKPYRTKLGREDEEREKMKSERWRDDPDVIRARLAAVSVATVICCLGVFAVLLFYGTVKGIDAVAQDTLLRLGLLPQFGLSAGLAHLITPLLFLGPLFCSYLRRELPFQRNWMWETHVMARFLSVHGLRNYWIAPMTEEIVFRACVLSIYHLSGASRKYMIYFAPLTFGLAHVHHAWDTYNRYGRTWSAAQRALAITIAFQLCYTTLFGMHVSYLFLRTGSILPPITAHIWCNIMGIPEIVWELKIFPKHRKVIIVAYLSGIAAFVYTLQKWSQMSGNLYWPSQSGEE
ncbi:hypothetical protein BYT27DRAFT_7197287 [Phlegmacium glaucopus]|nr:hypothetical protein BYT27DRAFT_7197287 [Phlegmacium glaucopus]